MSVEVGQTRDQPRLEVVGVTKRFPGVQALTNVSLRVMPGEVLALIGENGAGKSTLMKILAGVHLPDEGELRYEGASIRFAGPSQAIAAGVSLIHQELNLADNLSIAENVFLGREIKRGPLVDYRQMRQQSAVYLKQVGLELEASRSLAGLSVAQQQLVEIAKALAAKSKVLIMDEPTSSLTVREAEKLFDVVDGLRRDGVSIIYISHRLGEVQRLADRVEILRDGKNVGELSRQQITHDAMVRGMVGRELAALFPHQTRPLGEVRLSVDQLRVETAASHPIDLQVRGGEIVGLAGLVGAGRSELLETIFGVRPRLGGTVAVDGVTVSGRQCRDTMDAGLALVPEDRKQTGLVLEMTVEENLTLTTIGDDRAAPLRNRSRERQLAADMVQKLQVRPPQTSFVVANFSGGNQQKVALGKWLARNPKVLLLDEPTRGVDIGAKHEIYTLMESLAEQGCAILFASSEMEEILGMSDRALVMHEGKITGQLGRSQLSEEAIMRLAVGNPSETRSHSNSE
jgi:ribose transport system ATP-binding protein